MLATTDTPTATIPADDVRLCTTRAAFTYHAIATEKTPRRAGRTACGRIWDAKVVPVTHPTNLLDCKQCRAKVDWS